MEKITRFIECLLPITLCNLKCPYCYVIQRHNRKMAHADLHYPVDHMIKCLSKERFGGMCFFSICGAGETMLCPELPTLVKGLLNNGHFINITTNGTITKAIDSIISKTSEDERKRLHIAFSLHYLELKKRGLLDRFFNNVTQVKEAGISFVVQLNLTDEYLPYIDEIKSAVKDRLGAFPQIAATRDEVSLDSNIRLRTKIPQAEYNSIGKSFDSPLFDCTLKFFNNPPKGFCYAGKWSYVLNLQDGTLKSCYASPRQINIFSNPDAPISLDAVGHNCKSLFCMNSSHFLSMGVNPEIQLPSYGELRNRKTVNGSYWYNKTARELLYHKLYESNQEYSKLQKFKCDIKGSLSNLPYGIYSSLPLWAKALIKKLN